MYSVAVCTEDSVSKCVQVSVLFKEKDWEKLATVNLSNIDKSSCGLKVSIL